ncbi:MAG TPA: hypothetical protein PK372_09060, partial [Rugosibacter sp.]|nr:hypothetical protein [Rugosibacter sp.]
MPKEVKEKPQYAIVASVQLPSVSDVEFEASLTELRELAKTLGFTVIHTFTQKRASFDAGAYVGVGKREEIRYFVKGEWVSDDEPDDDSDDDSDEMLDEDGRATVDGTVENAKASTMATTSLDQPIEVIFVDHEISPSQARNLEKAVGCQVMDRTMVILEIFHRNARSRAAKAQVEIARLGYMAPRLREAAKLA